ncbi:MAG: flagellar export chaperone FlgN [Candidatus Glassbacteria bacterium]|nr:flagellar export chaperone FlgN [Candidatus Glassbacteria bacterium]
MAEQKTKENGPEKLHRILSAMAGDLERLYDCLRAQQRALVKCRLDDFNKTLELENRLAERNLDRERQRRELVAGMFGENSDKASLKELTAGMSPPWPGRFKALAERLRQAGNMVQTMKKQNEFLITSARDLVSERLKLMLELARLNRNVYEKSGKKSKRANLHKVLDRKL